MTQRGKAGEKSDAGSSARTSPRGIGRPLLVVVLAAGAWWLTTSRTPGDAGWTRSANYTTCQQWASEMTPPQREAMASQLLPIMRAGADKAASDARALIPAFVDAIGATCRSPAVAAYGEYVITAAAALTFTQDKRFQP
jgi:hypothetical protein